jgi:PTH1 family peptidyl-tRNA hydrolase
MGYLALDFWAESKGLTFKPGRGDFYQLTHKSPDGNVTFLKPTSYMNLSGIPIRQLMRYKNLIPENVLAVCDDVALPLGALRIRKTGSDGGQKGLVSIITELGTESFPRLRLGIYTEGWRGELRNYVLSRIPAKRREDVVKVLTAAAAAIDCILENGVTETMNRFNRNILMDTSESSSDETV